MTAERPAQPPDPRLLHAVLRYLDGHSSPDEVSGLAGQLRADPERQRQMARLLISVGHLRDLDEAAFPDDRLAVDAAGIPRLDPGSGRGRSRRIVTAAVALAVAAAVVLVVRVVRDRSHSTLAEAPGERARPAAARPGTQTGAVTARAAGWCPPFRRASCKSSAARSCSSRMASARRRVPG